MHGGAAVNRRRLPSYTGYLIERCAYLYLLLPTRNLLAAAANRIEPVDKLVAALAAQHLAHYASKLVMQAQLELLRATSRVEVVESYAPAGVLDVILTGENLARFRPPVWRRVARGPSPQERLCLCALLARTVELLDKAYEAAREALDMLTEQGIDPDSPVLRRLRRRLSRARRSTRRLLLHACGPYSLGRPAWSSRCAQILGKRGRRLGYIHALLEGALAALSMLLENVEAREAPLAITARGAGEPAGRRLTAIRMSLERLYELYTLYVVLRALQSLGTITAKDSEITVIVDGNGRITVFYNTRPRVGDRPLSRIALGDSSQLDARELERVSGIPDITLIIDSRKKIVIEVKHSRNPVYLTLARFKTIAYIHEYDADAGILVYPGKAARRPLLLDEEYRATHVLLERAEQEGYVEIKLHRNARLIILPLPPVRSEEERNIKNVTGIVESLLA